MLEGWLDHHRETLVVKCAGLTDAQLWEASVPPSAFGLLGLRRAPVGPGSARCGAPC